MKRAGATFKGLCPFHEEKTPSFTVHPARQTFKCFGCGAGGDVFTFVQTKERVDFLEARRILADRAGIVAEEETPKGASGPSKREVARANAWAQKLFRQYYTGSEGEAARQYVARRGIQPEVAEEFGIGLAVDSFDALIRRAGQTGIDPKLLQAAGLVKERQSGGYYDTFRHRLMFPIVDATDRVVGFGGRTMGDDPAKYLNTPATLLFDKSTQLFGLDRAKHGIGQAGRAIIVEGYTDCIMAHQHGFTETVATLGTAMTEAHAAVLRRYADRVLLLFDSDEAGQRAADRALTVTLAGGLEVELARVPRGKDPCDLLAAEGAEAFESVLKEGVPALEFKWGVVSREFSASQTGPARKRAIEAYLEFLSQWLGRGSADPIQKGLLVNQLSKILALPPEDILRRLDRLVGRAAARPSYRRDTAEDRDGTSDPAAAALLRPKNVEQIALRQIVESLLNAPELWPEASTQFEPDLIEDPTLASIARELVKMLEAGEPVELVDLLGRFDSPAIAAVITDLHRNGERRGAFAETIDGALNCLETCAGSRELVSLAAEIRETRRLWNGETAERPQPISIDTDSVDGEDIDVQSEDGQLAELQTEAFETQEPVLPAAAPADEDEKLKKLAARAKNPHFLAAKVRRRFQS